MNLTEVFGIHAPLLQIALRSAVVYVAIVIAMRVTGRRQLGQMTPFDLVLILLIANAVQNAMVGPDNSVLGGLVAAAVLLVLNQLTDFLTDRFPFLRRSLAGEPILLVNDGHLIDSHLRKAMVSPDLVLQAMREHGFEKLSDVHIAVLEVDGTISIVPKEGGKAVRTKKSVRSRHRVRAVRPGGS